MRIPFAYTSGLPIALGDRIQWSESGNYVGGGSYQGRGTGVVIEFGPAYVMVKCESGRRNSCSQRLGSDDRDLSNQRHSLWFDKYDAENQVKHYSGLVERAD
jgi:hypothetical protein